MIYETNIEYNYNNILLNVKFTIIFAKNNIISPIISNLYIFHNNNNILSILKDEVIEDIKNYIIKNNKKYYHNMIRNIKLKKILKYEN